MQLEQAQFGERTNVDQADIAHQQNEDAASAARIKIEGENLVLANKRERLAVQKAQQEGEQIDASASKVRGYVVTKSGQYVRDAKGHRIKVKQQTSSGGNSKEKFQEAVGAAESAYNTKGLIPGQFVLEIRYLTKRYGITRGQARKALIAAGWKPDGVRPKKK
jgi:hypothetical protein